MLESIRKLLKNTNNISRSAYIWNAINAIISAMESPVVLMVLFRTNGTYDAGIFSISFSIAGLMLYIGLYGIRRFQSSDVNEVYSFEDYHGMRIISCTAMMIASIAYCAYGSAFNDYSADKVTVIMLICFVRCIQAYSDVYHGRMQQVGRLDVATKASAIRYVAEILVYAIALIVSRDLIISTIAFTISSLLIMLLTSVNAGKDYCTYKPRFNKHKLTMLIINGFPLFISLFLNMYISNAPKYAIDAYLSEEIQAIYNTIFMPAFVVMLISNFIFNPILTHYAELWLANTRAKTAELIGNIKKQILVVIGLTILGLAVAATIGIPVLSIIFGVDLSAYKTELCVVMIGGGALAYATFFSTIITIIRAQRNLLYSYGFVALIAKLFAGTFVRNYGIMGAASLYSVLMITLAIVLFAIMFVKVNSRWKTVQD